MEHHTNRHQEFRYEIEFANEQIELDTYRLLTILSSSKILHSPDSPVEGLNLICWRYEQAEVYRIVFNLAIRARNILDKGSQELNIIAESPVGTNDTKKLDLSFRESCNKLIHSKHINFGLRGYKSLSFHEGITEFLYVYGTKQKTEWKVTIDLFKFCDNILQINI